MSNNQLMEYKENIFTKVKNFFKKLFAKKHLESIENIEHNVNNRENYEINKKDFMELYEKSKKGDVDLFSISPDKLKKMCILLEEEIKIKERNLQEKKKRLDVKV